MSARPLERPLAVLLLLAATQLPACAAQTSVATGETGAPAVVEALGDTGLHSVQLTERASARLGLETAEVGTAAGADGQQRLVLPYSAVLYDAQGQAWAYTATGPLTFVRAPLVVERVDADLAVLASGPAAGTVVVAVGAAELYGAEHDVGH